ncbi:MAG: hypothetical protein AAGD25_05635 [Cyanobacteria bacterium P01_F01_bin.150]
MASDLTRISISEQQAETELELLQVLLSDEAYPWSVDTDTDNAHQQYFNRLESQWNQDLAAAEVEAIATKGRVFFQHLDQAWGNADAQLSQAGPTQLPALASIQAILTEKFQDRIPTNLIHALTHKAHELAAQPLSLAEQLVQSVQDILPEWGTEDLQVLARPYAYAMRGPETDKLEVALRSVRHATWAELSRVEQARLGLAIARYTFSQMPTDASVKQ